MISIAHVLIALLGVVAGIIFGAIPGMTATMAVAVFLRRYFRRTGSGNPDQYSGNSVFHHDHL